MTNDSAQSQSSRYDSLDLWRGVACLMVIGFHAAYYVTENGEYPPGIAGNLFHLIHLMSLGVPIFFVISGYCIAAACDNQRGRASGNGGLDARTASASHYFLRRFRRIFPPYWIALALFVVAAMLLTVTNFAWLFRDAVHPLPAPASLTTWQWLGNLTLTETWRSTLAHPGGDWWGSLFLTHAWTLCYEEQFYAVCGLALLLSRRHFFPILGVITFAVAIVTCVRELVANSGGRQLNIDGFFFDGHWLLFAAGVAVYYRIRHASLPLRWTIDLLLLFACLWMTRLNVRTNYLIQELCGGLLFALVAIALYRWDQPLNRSRFLQPLTACGTMCYSLYLVHWPIVKVISHALYAGGIRGPWPTLFVTMPICYGASVAAGWAFFILVERRFLNTRVRIMQKPQTPIDATLATSPA